MSSKIELIAGLGNPGAKYEGTRHNVGFWFIDQLAQSKGCSLRHESKFHGEVGKISKQTISLISIILLLLASIFMLIIGFGIMSSKYLAVTAIVCFIASLFIEPILKKLN